VYVGIPARRSSIVPGGKASLIDEQILGRGRRRGRLVAARRRLPGLLLVATGVLIGRAAKVGAAKHRLAERVQLLALVDAAVRRRGILLLDLLPMIGHR